ncbi:hypothetical protein [Enterococcus sp. CWB-B31]|uniref:hypothetical protein n=1 Tax=Enterococcus sp. CWB-B31 TaxID=2885159 RepID=UPI001E2F0ABB|nr:hypothetical protein [Enterococcus sp. CWB-B31]MCB5953991.1 hypothetical protein [Enterococcus sp. CWB-B31]
MKKKIIGVLFGALVLTGLSACSGNPSTQASSNNESSVSSESTEQLAESSSSSSSSSESKTSDYDLFSLMIESAQSQIPSLKEQLGEQFGEITIEEGADHTVIYNYTFAQEQPFEIDAEAMKPTLVKALKPVFDGIVAVIPDVQIEINYMNPDDSVLATFNITQEDIDQLEDSSQE